MESSALLTYVLACFAIIIVPGPSVTVIIANSLRKGTAAGLMNVAGTQVGLVPMILVVALGLETVISVMGQAFFWVKLFGAAYLIWLGISLLRSDGTLGASKGTERSPMGYFWQGMLVIWSNPKALFFFGAFIPQFVNIEGGSPFLQTLMLGGIFIAVATVCDGAYAILAGKAGSMLTKTRVRFVEVASGIFLVFGGIWLATQKQ